MPGTLRVDVFGEQCELHGVLPVAMAHVRTPLHALADEADALRMADRRLVEAITRKLEAVKAELVDQIALQQPRTCIRDAPTTEGRSTCERLQVHDPMQLAQLAVAECACPLTVQLCDQPAEPLRLALRALDRFDQGVAVVRALPTEERLDVVVRVELDQPVDVLGGCPTKREQSVHRCRLGNRRTSPSRARAEPDSRQDQR